MGLFEQTNEASCNREQQQLDKSRDTSFDWLVRRAESDLAVAQALAAAETQRADQIKRLETTLVGQINELQHQIIESREVEVNDLKSQIFACADRIARLEGTQSAADVAKEFVKELGDLRRQFDARQTVLESHYSGFEQLEESLGTQMRSLEKELQDKLDSIQIAQGEMRHLQSETQSLAERVVHAESATWQARTLALRNTQQLEQTAESLRCEIVALNAAFNDLNDKQHKLRLPETLLNEVAQNLDAKIAAIQDQVAQEHNSQLAWNARFRDLDAELAMLIERLANTESLSHETHALLQAELNSASDFRTKTAQEFATLQGKLGDPSAQDQAIQKLEFSLRNITEEWQRQALQKFMLLESRDAERETRTRELEKTLTAKNVEQDARIDGTLGLLANGQEGFRRLKSEIQALADRIVHSESGAQKAQATADASATRMGKLENTLKNDIAALHAEFAKLADLQRTFRIPDEQLREIECKLGVKVDEIQQQLTLEREDFDHWGKGLRESFGAELSAIQARLSERQSHIEHRYARLECWEETAKANLEVMEALLKEKLKLEVHDHEEWHRLESQLTTLGARTSELESRARQVEDRFAESSQEPEQSVAVLRNEIIALEPSLDHRSLPTYEFVIRNLEIKLDARLFELEEQFTRQLSLYDSNGGDRDRWYEQALSGFKNELSVLKTAVDHIQNALPPSLALSPTVEESLWTKIRELDQQLAEQFILIDSRAAEQAQHAYRSIEALQCELTAIQTRVNQCTGVPDESLMHNLEESISTKIEQFEQHVAQKLIQLDERDAERTQQAEEVIANLKSEMAAFNGKLIQRPVPISPADPALCDLEKNFSAKIDELRQQMGQHFRAFDSREADLKELKERSQSLIQRVTHLSTAIQLSQKTAAFPVQPMASRPELSAPPAPAVKTEGNDNPAEIQARSEKEQLIKLQERMSSEIERVRAELKERSGRWKVRKSAS